jgi:hypothetical protein
VLWFLDVNWVMMSLTAAQFAAVIHIFTCAAAAIRIGRCEAIWIVVAVPIYTFLSCLLYTLILSISVSYTYQYVGAVPSGPVITYWGLGFGSLYVVLKIISAGYIK